MSEHPAAAGGAGKGKAPLDHELNLRGLVYFTVALVALVVVSAWLMWVLSGRLRGEVAAADPPPSPLPEARMPYAPPEPRLQASPEADMATLRREEDRVLEGYAWVDRAGGVARIPIERAMDLLAAEAAAPAEAGVSGDPQPATDGDTR